MATSPLLQLSDLSLTFGGAPLLAGVDVVVQPGDRIALVGRNGSGKSTLMKIMAGLVEPDSGTRAVPPGIHVGYMEQEPDMSGHATLGDYAAAGLPPGEAYRVEIAAEGLRFDPGIATEVASGGERRRAALARILAEAPDLMLLDEPTNHLDIAAIRWLEATLAETRAAFALISHDRAILETLTRATLWVDRGTVRRQEAGFAAFEAWRDRTWDEEDLARHKLDRRIKAEARWAVEGISARRKRNQGRLRALHDMRADRAAMTARAGTAQLALDAGPQSGKRVIEARGLTKGYADRPIVNDLSIRITRGERIALVGPNGAGKTTLVGLLTGRIAPDAGEVALGTGLEIAVFDQNRAALDPEATLWETLAGDPEIGVRGRADQVMVRGTPRHVVGYLKDFLFSEAQARAPVRSLSGGERARLLLARLMARQSNLLVLDEPTNDLDIETLDLLQDVLGDYDGTVILVSHDRDFIERVASRTIVLDGTGRAVIHAGGWRAVVEAEAAAATANAAFSRPVQRRQAAAPSPPAPAAAGLTFTERHRLDALPDEIAALEAEVSRISALLADADLARRAPEKFARATDLLADRHAALRAAEQEWLTLAERAEG